MLRKKLRVAYVQCVLSEDDDDKGKNMTKQNEGKFQKLLILSTNVKKDAITHKFFDLTDLSGAS